MREQMVISLEQFFPVNSSDMYCSSTLLFPLFFLLRGVELMPGGTSSGF